MGEAGTRRLVDHLAWDMPYRARLDNKAPDVTATNILCLALMSASLSYRWHGGCSKQNGRIQAK